LLVVDLDRFCIIADPTCAPASAFPIWVYPYLSPIPLSGVAFGPAAINFESIAAEKRLLF
jgi:hypothetical protein